jgi:hypothetical protein
MATAIKERYGDRVGVLGKISRQRIFDSAQIGPGNLRGCPHDLRLATEEQRANFDMHRVQMQMLAEKELQMANLTYFVDGAALVKLAYMLYLSAPKLVQMYGQSTMDALCRQVINHCNLLYSSIFYLPVTRIPFVDADHRLFKSKWIRTAQDAILHRLISTEISIINVETFYTADMNLVFDELSKRGL